LFLNQRGQRLGVKGAHNVITGIAARASLDDEITAHVLRHTFATPLVRAGTDLVIVAELLGHARLETTRGYTRPTAEDRTPSTRPAPRRPIETSLRPLATTGTQVSSRRFSGLNGR